MITFQSSLKKEGQHFLYFWEEATAVQALKPVPLFSLLVELFLYYFSLRF